jgi:hypothetical protein
MENGSMLNNARSKENLLTYNKTIITQSSVKKDEKIKRIPPIRILISGPAIEIRADVSNLYSPEERTTPGAMIFIGRNIENKENKAKFGSNRNPEYNPKPCATNLCANSWKRKRGILNTSKSIKIMKVSKKMLI